MKPMPGLIRDLDAQPDEGGLEARHQVRGAWETGE